MVPTDCSNVIRYVLVPASCWCARDRNGSNPRSLVLFHGLEKAGEMITALDWGTGVVLLQLSVNDDCNWGILLHLLLWIEE